VTDLRPQQCLRESRFDLEPGVRRAFWSLLRSVFPSLHSSSKKANGFENVRVHSGNVVHVLYDATVD